MQEGAIYVSEQTMQQMEIVLNYDTAKTKFDTIQGEIKQLQKELSMAKYTKKPKIIPIENKDTRELLLQRLIDIKLGEASVWKNFMLQFDSSEFETKIDFAI